MQLSRKYELTEPIDFEWNYEIWQDFPLADIKLYNRDYDHDKMTACECMFCHEDMIPVLTINNYYWTFMCYNCGKMDYQNNMDNSVNRHEEHNTREYKHVDSTYSNICEQNIDWIGYRQCGGFVYLVTWIKYCVDCNIIYSRISDNKCDTCGHYSFPYSIGSHYEYDRWIKEYVRDKQEDENIKKLAEKWGYMI